MTEAWERGVGSGAGTSDLPIALENSRRKACRCKRNCCRKAIWPRTYDGSRCHKARRLWS